ncbi:MAG: ABC transporter permease [Candidatus Sumerlaeaceae bacterium]
MRFERFVARRYLFSGHHKALVSAITLISIAGVAVGVFALIVVIAVMEGFDRNLVEKIIGAYAHIEIVRASTESPPIELDKILPEVDKLPGVKAAGPVIMRQALLQVIPSEGEEPRQTAVFVQGVDLDRESRITKLMEKVAGKAKPDQGEIVIGKKVAQRLYIPLGARVTVFSPVFVRTPTGGSALARNAQVAGIFDSGFPEADEMIAYTDLATARALFMVPENEVDGIHLVVDDPQKVDQIKRLLQEKLGAAYLVTTWRERNPVLFDALVLEKWAMFIILLLIVLVASFNIVGTLIMVVIEKTREIGILKSMGATEETIMRIFVLQGLFIGGIGTLVGAVAGLSTCYLLQNHVRIDILSEAYLSDRIPILMDVRWNILIVLSALAICLLTSLYPARQAAKLDPVEALRYE